MNKHVHHFTDEERAELLSNPYTSRVTECKVVFTLEFKRFVLCEINKPGMTTDKVFQKAGYRPGLFTTRMKHSVVNRIRAEASSEEGLQEPKPVRKNTPAKKQTSTQIKELEERIMILEQQIDFLKKSRHLRETGMMPPDSTG